MMYTRVPTISILRLAALLWTCSTVAASCTTGSGNAPAAADSPTITEAQGLTIERAGGYTTVSVANPWKQGQTLHTYILVPRDSEIPSTLPEGTLVRTPIERAVVYSAVHGGVIKELGEMSSIAGVCDAEYFNMAEIQEGIADGSVADAGSSMSPSVERIIALQPDAIILSPFQNAGYGALTSLGVPIIECADYMESTPLGRAEWVKLFGELYCKPNAADSIFQATSAAYNAIKASVASAAGRPKVLTEMLYSGVWYVPGGGSYMAAMLRDAGAEYPWSDDQSTGSLSLDLPQVLNRASDADVWLIKPMAAIDYAALRRENKLYGEFKAFKEKRVYQCVTLGSTLYQDFPFHPDVLLSDYVAIFHPEIAPSGSTRYYHPLPGD